MGAVLLGWELGSGLGHVAKLVEVAWELTADGHTPVLVLKDIAGTRPFLKNLPFRILQAPIWTVPIPVPYQASTYADILAIKGFADPDGLGLMVDAWRSLLELTGAELVICDHAPTLCLAAYGELPTIVMGIGFAVPPAEGRDFPSLGPGIGVTVSTDRLLKVIQDVQRKRGRMAPETLPALFDSSARFVHTFEELDAYRDSRRSGVVEPMRAPPPPLPPVTSRCFFAYLNPGYPGIADLLPHLASMGFRGAAYIRGNSSAMALAARQAGVAVFDEPPPLSEVLAESAAIIHHGGLNTAEIASASGRPQVVLTEHLEHELTARALQGLGVGCAFFGRTSLGAVRKALFRVIDTDGYSERALAMAHVIERRQYQGCLPKIISECVTRLS